jgi:RHS repeat-associated protein
MNPATGISNYPHYDQVGSLRAITDSSGNVIKQIDYDSFGNVISDSNPAFTVPFGFAGGLHDNDTRLVRFGFRDYDSAIGRWTAKDPIGFAGGDANLFQYVAADPVNFSDPLGLTREDIDRVACYVARTQPDLDVDPHIGTFPLRWLGIDGIANPFTRNITVDTYYLKEDLSPQDLRDLENLIIHESIHRTRPRRDSILRPRTHDDIYDEADYRQRHPQPSP